MRRSIFIAFLTLLTAQLFAQPINSSSPEQKLVAVETALANGDNYNALELLEEIYKDDRQLKYIYQIAGLHLSLRDYERAERWYSRIVNRKSRREPNPYMPEARFIYGQVLKLNGKYQEAISELGLYISESENIDNIPKAKKAIEGAQMALEMDPDTKISVINAGPNVNSRYSEYSPQLVGDKLYFTSFMRKKVLVLDGKENDYHSKLYVSSRQGDGWTEAEETGAKKINRTGYHTANFCVNKAGTRMYFTRVKMEGNNIIESKLYSSDKGPEGWEGAQEITGINGDYLVRQPAIGELFGNEVIFFSSDMDGGYGGFDLYYSTRAGEGFTPPLNLGNTINTAGDEVTPFYQGGVLSYSTNGLVTIGGFDIYQTEWNGSEWSTPENLGRPINSNVDDLYYSIDPNKEYGFITSNREGTKSVKNESCCYDIFQINLEKVVIELNAATLFNEQALPGANVTLVEIVNDRPGESDARSKEKDNKYTFLLKPNRFYRLIGEKDGFLPDSLDFNTTDITSSTVISKVLNLTEIEKEPEYITISSETPIRLNNIYYDFDDDKILTDAEKDLTFLYNLLIQYPDMVIELSSHTDSRGTKGYNEKLSQRRADSAKRWLLAKGVTDDRIQAVGYGEEKVLNRCVNGVKCSEEEHQLNRRTEFKILSGPTSIRIESKVLKDTQGENPQGQKKNK